MTYAKDAFYAGGSFQRRDGEVTTMRRRRENESLPRPFRPLAEPVAESRPPPYRTIDPAGGSDGSRVGAGSRHSVWCAGLGSASDSLAESVERKAVCLSSDWGPLQIHAFSHEKIYHVPARQTTSAPSPGSRPGESASLKAFPIGSLPFPIVRSGFSVRAGRDAETLVIVARKLLHPSVADGEGDLCHRHLAV